MVREKIKNFFSFLCGLVDDVFRKITPVLRNFRYKILLTIFGLFVFFVATCVSQNLFVVGMFILMLYASFEFFNVLEQNSEKNLKLLGYFYILIPFLSIFIINSKMGYTSLFWFVSFIILNKIIEYIADETSKNIKEIEANFGNENTEDMVVRKNSSMFLMIFYKMIFVAIFSLIFSFIIKKPIIKFLGMNLLLTIIMFFEGKFFSNFKNKIDNSGKNFLILSRLDGFVLTGLFVNIINLFNLL